jgi:hypothetical protein
MLPRPSFHSACLLAILFSCASVAANELEIAGTKYAVVDGKVVITAKHFKDSQLPAEYQSFLFRYATRVGEFGLISERFTIRERSKELGTFVLNKQLKLSILHRHSPHSAIMLAEVVTTIIGDVAGTSRDRSLFWFEGFDLSASDEGEQVNLYGQAVIASDFYDYELPTGEKKSVVKIVPALLPRVADKHLTSAPPTARHPAFINAVARNWTDASKARTTVGVPIDYVSGKVSIFSVAKNKVFEIDVMRLSESDRRWIESQVDQAVGLRQAASNSRR